MTIIIKINGKDVPVDDAFNDLTPEQQEMEKAHIADQMMEGKKFGGIPMAEPKEKEPGTILGLPVELAPEAGAITGATVGAALGPSVGTSVDKPIASAANAIRPTVATPNVNPNAPQSVRNWLATQTSTPYAGGRDYEEANRKANIAGGKPVQSRGSSQGIRRGNLGINAQPPAATIPQKAAANILNADQLSKPGVPRRVLGMGVAGGEFGNMIKEADEGNYGRAALSGLGAVGGVASQSRIKPVRAIGTALSVGVPAIQKFLLGDKEDEDKSNIQEKAAGGSVTSPKLQSLSDYLDQLMQQAQTAPAAIAAPAMPQVQPPQGGMVVPPQPGMPQLPQPPQGGMPQPQAQAPLGGLGVDAIQKKAEGGLVGLAAGGKLGKVANLVKEAASLGRRSIDKFDPRFDKRVGEIPKLQNTVLHTQHHGVKDVPEIYLPDYEGHPFLTSISDRSFGGAQLQGMNDVMFNNPVDLTGGKLYMYNNPGKVWAAGDVPADNIMRQARALKDFTGKDPLYVPWQMAPTGSDFSHMTGQTMLAYAEAAMPKGEKKQLDKYLKNIIPDWKGIDNPESTKQFLSAPAGVRGAIQDLMDKNFRDTGGIGIGQARLAIADPEQLIGKDGSVSHVGRIFADQDPIRNTGNPSYPSGIPGEGIGRIPEDFNIYQLLSKQAEKRGVIDPANPTRPDLRSIEVYPASGVLDEKTLMDLGYAKGGKVGALEMLAKKGDPIEANITPQERAIVQYHRDTISNNNIGRDENGYPVTVYSNTIDIPEGPYTGKVATVPGYYDNVIHDDPNEIYKHWAEQIDQGKWPIYYDPRTGDTRAKYMHQIMDQENPDKKK